MYSKYFTIEMRRLLFYYRNTKAYIADFSIKYVKKYIDYKQLKEREYIR